MSKILHNMVIATLYIYIYISIYKLRIHVMYSNVSNMQKMYIHDMNIQFMYIHDIYMLNMQTIKHTYTIYVYTCYVYSKHIHT